MKGLIHKMNIRIPSLTDSSLPVENDFISAMYIIENQQYIYRITNYRQMNCKKSLNSICLSISCCIDTLWCRALPCSST